MSTTTHRTAGGLEDIVMRSDAGKACVAHGHGYCAPGRVACELTDTGNGFIAKFPPAMSCNQDYYVCFGYSQAYYLILAMSAFKQELGFDA